MITKVNPVVTKTKTVVVSPETMTVTLTKTDAGRIASVLGNVCGTGDGKAEYDLYCQITDWIGHNYRMSVDGYVRINKE